MAKKIRTGDQVAAECERQGGVSRNCKGSHIVCRHPAASPTTLTVYKGELSKPILSRAVKWLASIATVMALAVYFIG